MDNRGGESMYGRVPSRVSRLLAVGVAGLGLVVAGCGSDSDGAPAGGSGSSAKQGGTVKVGIAAPTSGAVAFYAPFGTGAKAYFDYINDQGGVNGYKIDSSVLDNKATAAGGVTTARTIMRDKPFAMFMVGSATFAAASDLIKRTDPDLPVFATASATVLANSGVKNAFGLNPSYARECFAHIDFVKNQLGAKSVAIVYQDDPVGQPIAEVCPDYAKKQGIEKVTKIPVPSATTNFGPIAAKIKESGADVAMAYTFSQLLAGTQKAAKAIGYNGKWITFATNDESYIKLAGADVSEGLYLDQYLEPVSGDTPEVKLFRDEMTKRLGADTVAGGGAAGWTIAAIITDGIKLATEGGKKLTRESFVAALDTIKGKQLGMAFDVTYAGTDHSTATSTVRMFQVKGGKLEQIGEAQPLPEG
jgi:branched-chain amino acid transport system substrate-binding protein